MKHYILVDSQGWVSNFLDHSLEDATKRATGLLEFSSFRESLYIDIYEVCIDCDSILICTTVYKNGEVRER